MGEELLRDAGQAPGGHEDHHRAPEACQLGPVALLRQEAVALEDADFPGQSAVGEGDARSAGGAVEGAEAGHHLEGQAGLPEGQGLLAAAAEKEGVAALQADHLPALPDPGHQQGVDLPLFQAAIPRPLAHEDRLGAFREEVEVGLVQQGVVEDRLRPLQGPEAAEGEEVRVAGAGAHEPREAALKGLHAHAAAATRRCVLNQALT